MIARIKDIEPGMAFFSEAPEMKPVPSSMTAAVFSVGKEDGSAIEEFFPPESLVIVIHESVRNSRLLPPLQFASQPHNHVSATGLLRRSHGKLHDGYFAARKSLAPKIIDVLG